MLRVIQLAAPPQWQGTHMPPVGRPGIKPTLLACSPDIKTQKEVEVEAAAAAAAEAAAAAAAAAQQQQPGAGVAAGDAAVAPAAGGLMEFGMAGGGEWELAPAGDAAMMEL
jgi:hypothetical protein